MSSQDSLLKRMALGSPPRRRVDLDGRSVADLHRSILINLQRIVSCRAGGSKACPDYGLPELDHSADGFNSQVAEFGRDLKATIEAYEPRLTEVLVTQRKLKQNEVDQDPLNLKLEIKGKVSIVGSRQKLRLLATISPNGRVTVSHS